MNFVFDKVHNTVMVAVSLEVVNHLAKVFDLRNVQKTVFLCLQLKDLD
jgi:hypothetical protein